MRKKEEKERKIKKVRVKSYGLHRGRVIILWLLFIGAFVFAIYKNFTGIDKHTIHEKEVIQEKVTDTTGIEKFARNFAGYYFSWDTKEATALKERSDNLSKYMSKDIYEYSQSMLNNTKNMSEVTGMDVWKVEDMGNGEYRVYMDVVQKITGESGTKEAGQSCQMDIYKEKDGSMIVVTLPTLAQETGFSDYRPEKKETVRDLDNKTEEEIKGFLEDFFKVYPVSAETELKYYAEPGTVAVINKEGITYKSIDDMTVTEYKDNAAKVSVKVTYLLNSTQAAQTQQYDLAIKKTDNWKIIEVR